MSWRAAERRPRFYPGLWSTTTWRLALHVCRLGKVPTTLLELPRGPGLGIELDEDALAAQIGHDWTNPEEYDADDGSVMDW